MKTKQTTEYTCELCKTIYDSAKEAQRCESRPVTEDKGVKVGDTIRIIHGDGAGYCAKVTRVFVIDQHWGHYNYKKYWHTVALTADLIGTWGSRMLTFDDYEVM